MKTLNRLLTTLALGSMLAAIPANAAPDKKIERVWKAKCASCHGADGKGATEKGKQMQVKDMTTAEYQKQSDDDLKKAINEGVKKTEGGVKKEMDPFKDELKAGELDGLIAFIRGLAAK